MLPLAESTRPDHERSVAVPRPLTWQDKIGTYAIIVLSNGFVLLLISLGTLSFVWYGSPASSTTYRTAYLVLDVILGSTGDWEAALTMKPNYTGPFHSPAAFQERGEWLDSVQLLQRRDYVECVAVPFRIRLRQHTGSHARGV